MDRDVKIRRNFRRSVILSSSSAAVLFIILNLTAAGRWLEDGAFDACARLTAQPSAADPRIVIVDIDNASFDALTDKLGRWPWPRQVWTEVVRYVSKGHPAAFAFDAVFSGKESEAPEMDANFAQVIRGSGDTVLAFSFVAAQLDSPAGKQGETDTRAEGTSGECLQEVSGSYGLACGLPRDKWILNLPFEQLAQAAVGLGSVNSTPDGGGIIRHEPLAFGYDSANYPSLGTRAFEVATGLHGGWRKELTWFGSRYLVQGNRRLPVDRYGRLLLLWRGDSIHTYLRVPLWELICSIYPAQCPNSGNRWSSQFFRDKVVLLGASAAGSYEARPTPMDKQAPGFIVHATMIDNLLNGVAMRETPPAIAAAIIVLLAAAGGLAQWRWRSFWAGAIASAIVLVLYVVTGVLVYRGVHLVLPLVAPALALVTSFGGGGAVRYVTTGRELRQTRGMLDRYVAPQLVSYVMSNLERMHLNGDRRELTILISDVRNFTTMTEKADPMKLISQLNEYLEAMTEIIFKHNGIVDKFIGDGILAYWGAFTAGENHAYQAAMAGLEMLVRLKELNAGWQERSDPVIAIGIGINTGNVIFGNIGKGKKVEFTVIGDAVNLASRLEGLNKEFHTQIIVSDSTKSLLGSAAQLRPLGGVTVKGKAIETVIYELQGLPANPQLKTL